MIFAPLVALILAATPQDKTSAEWVEELAGENASIAKAALVLLPVSETLSPLTACIREAAPEHAWRAGEVVRILVPQVKSRNLAELALDLTAVVLDADRATPNREVAALALRDFGRAAKACCKDLARFLAESPDASTGLAATLGCAGIGEEAVKRLQKNLAKEGLMKTVWAASAIACAGEQGRGAKRRLADAIEEEESLSAFLACRAVAVALAEVTDAEKAREALAEQSANLKGKIWRGGEGLNFGGIMPIDVKAFIAFYAAEAKDHAVDRSALTLPESFDAPLSGGPFTLGDGVQCLAAHLTRKLIELDRRLAGEGFASWSEWNEAVGPSVELAKFLIRLDAHVPR